MDTSRRQFLKTAGGVALGGIAISGLAGSVLSCAPEAPPTPSPAPAPAKAPPLALQPLVSTKVEPLALPWPYKKLDAVAAAERAYTAYSNGGCMYGAFEGIVGELRDQVGAPYDDFPAAMMKYGAAGVIGWGTLCGALNGAAAAVYMVRDAATGNPIINELYEWYGEEALPDYKPKNPKFPTIITSVARSQLCHPSVTEWSVKSGLKIASPERAERCAWLTASVVKYTVDLLNAQADGTFKLVHKIPADATGCIACHAKGGPVENVHITSQTSCTVCHTDIKPPHPAAAK